MPSFADFQNEIYAAGIEGYRPELPTDLTRLEALAATRLSPEAHGYVAGSAGTGATARANRAAFEKWRIVPRMLRDVTGIDTAVEVLGTAMPAPLLLGPVGVQGILHPEAERAVARAAGGLGVPIVLSTVSSYSMEEVADASGNAPRWFQLYWPREKELAASLLERAARAGYSTLVVTVDTFRLAWRPHDLDHAYLPFLTGWGLANYFADPFFQGVVGGAVTAENRAQAIGYWTTIFGNPALTWSDLGWVRQHWRGPIVLKGICHPDDARRAADAGVDGIVVSNHGGRQVDGAVAALDSLPPIVTAVGDRLTILFDSGIRTGGDVMKALALGAKAVLVARPYAFALGLAGEEGVRHVLRCLLAELELSLSLSGLTHPDQLTPDTLTRNP